MHDRVYAYHCRGCLERFAMCRQPDCLRQARSGGLHTQVPAGSLLNWEAQGVAFPKDAVGFMECQRTGVRHEERLRSPEFAQSEATTWSSGSRSAPGLCQAACCQLGLLFTCPWAHGWCACLRGTLPSRGPRNLPAGSSHHPHSVLPTLVTLLISCFIPHCS